MLRLSRAFGFAFLAIGIAILVETVAVGGGEVGFLAAAVFIALGLIRLRALRSRG